MGVFGLRGFSFRSRIGKIDAIADAPFLCNVHAPRRVSTKTATDERRDLEKTQGKVVIDKEILLQEREGINQ